MQLQIRENTITVPAPNLEGDCFHTISNESKVTFTSSKINIFDENNTEKKTYKNCSSAHR